MYVYILHVWMHVLHTCTNTQGLQKLMEDVYYMKEEKKASP